MGIPNYRERMWLNDAYILVSETIAVAEVSADQDYNNTQVIF